MRHVKNRNIERFTQLLKPRHDFSTTLIVKACQRFIHQKRRRAHRQTAGDGNALTFAPGEFRRTARQKVSDSQEFHCFVQAFSGIGVLNALHTVFQILTDRKVIKKARFLKHITQTACVRRHKNLLFVILPNVAGHLDAPLGVLKSGNRPQYRRLAASRGPEQSRHPVVRHRKFHIERKTRRPIQTNFDESRHCGLLRNSPL